ncbi:MAG: HAMP domain-containing protein [Caldilineaceae bacterium]|nr:HAMP domain-containing protein [Caldilineaceae bacterium]
MSNQFPPSAPRPGARWPWQRSLQSRIVLTYGGIFVVVLVLLMIRVVQVVYTTQLSDAEHNLEIEAVLAANALEDPLSGYDAEFDEYARWEAKHDKEEDSSGDESRGDESRKDKKDDDKSSENKDGDGQRQGGGGETNGTQQPANGAASGTLAPVAMRLQAVADLYASDTGARVTILDLQGDVVADSAFAFDAVDNQLGQIEVQAALEGKEERDLRLEPLTGKQTLYVAAPIQQDHRLLGVVQVSQPLGDITDVIWSLLVSLLAAGALALGVATALGVWLSRRLLQPVRELEAASLAIAQGDFTRQVPDQAADELGALARAFNWMASEVQSVMKQQRQFVANASHELRTPITNIKLRSETLRDGGLHDPTIAERYVAEIDSEADRLGRLANALLDLSRLDGGDAARIAPDMDIAPVLLAVAQSMAMRARDAGQTLHVDVADRLPPLPIWPEQIEAVVVNLLDNAIKYTPEGGEIWLDGQSDGTAVRIRVSDTGPGIPGPDLPHIFERFYRVDKARSRLTREQGTGGAGLGLAIVKALAEYNGGRVWAESEAGHGALFVVEFPLGDT